MELLKYLFSVRAYPNIFCAPERIQIYARVFSVRAYLNFALFREILLRNDQWVYSRLRQIAKLKRKWIASDKGKHIVFPFASVVSSRILECFSILFTSFIDVSIFMFEINVKRLKLFSNLIYTWFYRFLDSSFTGAWPVTFSIINYWERLRDTCMLSPFVILTISAHHFTSLEVYLVCSCQLKLANEKRNLPHHGFTPIVFKVVTMRNIVSGKGIKYFKQ